MQKRTYITASLTILLVLGMSVMGFAQRKTGLNGATFLKIGVGARQIALGATATTLQNGGPNMMFWNPAGIAGTEGTSIALNHNRWLLEMDHNAFAVTHSLGEAGVIGVGLIHIGLGDIVADRDVAPTADLEPRQADKATSSTFSFYDMAVNVSWARQFSDKLALGASIKMIREKIDDQDASSIAGDFGVTYNVGWRGLVFGAAMTNLGGDLTYYQSGAPIPLTFSIGASVDLAKQENSVVVGMLDATKRQDSEQMFFGALEWTILDQFQLRGGYKFGYAGSKDNFEVNTTDEGLSFGGGLNFDWGGSNLQLDYAFTEFNVLDNTHRFSLSLNF